MMIGVGSEEFQFNPSDEELINGFLYPWLKQKKLPWNGFLVKEIYGPSSEPWKVFDNVESHWHSRLEEKGAIKYTIYAFTLLSRVSNSKRVSRRAGTGTWGGQTGPKIIQDSNNGQIIGQSKMLAFNLPGSEADFGHWTMHEYSLGDDLIRSSGVPNAGDVVVCKITKTVKKKKSGGTRASHPLAETNKLKNGYGYGGIPNAGDVVVCKITKTIKKKKENNKSVEQPPLAEISKGKGLWVRPPQIMNHAAVRDPFDVSVPAELDHPNQQDGGAAFKRQKTSGPGEGVEVEPNDDEDLSTFEAELELGIMANHDDESTNDNDNEDLSTFEAELENMLDDK